MREVMSERGIPMQAMICEVCGSSALSKENGHYICRYCKTKYTIEGINYETGKFGTYEISYEACEQYVGEDSVFLEYYPKTQRVVDCFK